MWQFHVAGTPKNSLGVVWFAHAWRSESVAKRVSRVTASRGEAPQTSRFRRKSSRARSSSRFVVSDLRISEFGFVLYETLYEVVDVTTVQVTHAVVLDLTLARSHQSEVEFWIHGFFPLKNMCIEVKNKNGLSFHGNLSASNVSADLFNENISAASLQQNCTQHAKKLHFRQETCFRTIWTASHCIEPGAGASFRLIQVKVS